MNITSLEPKLIHQIFSHLPIRDLLKLHLIQPNWSSIQQSLCSNKKSLTILIGTDAINGIANSIFIIPYENRLPKPPHNTCVNQSHYEQNGSLDIENALQFEWLDYDSAELLTTLLPNITGLTLSVRANVASKYIGEKSWNHQSIITQQVGYLVENWKLESAKLYIQIENSDYERAREFRDHDQHQLFRSINRVRTLKHLTIEIKTLYYENWKHTYDLSILSSLEEFYFNDGSFSPVDAIAESLFKYGTTNPRLQKIGLVHQVRLDHSEFYRKSSSKYLELSSKVDLFQGIQFNSSICENQQTKFCAQFSRLRSVNIYFTEHENLETIYRKLKSFEVLPELMHLKLYFFKPALAETNMESQNPIPCLPSVKILQIGSNIRSHTDLCPINWDLLLPNLVILHYDDCYFGCSDQCKIYSQLVEEDAAEALRLTYIRERLQPWKGCTEIKEIYWGNLNSWGSRYALDMNEFWYAHEVEADLKNQTKDD